MADDTLNLHVVNQAELARRAGMSKAGICRIFSGSRQPSANAVRKLAAVLGVGTGEFLDSLPAWKYREDSQD